jgi:outer membrane protein assembly factor BamB
MAADTQVWPSHGACSGKSRLLSIVRLILALILTGTVLPYAWARTLVFLMWMGRVEWRYPVLLVLGVFGVMALTFGLSRAFSMPDWLVGLAVTASLLPMNAILVGIYGGDLMPRPYVFLFLVAATAWQAWFAWMFYAPLGWSTRLGVLLLLLAAPLAFPRLVRIDGLTGDSHINFTWRWAAGQGGISDGTPLVGTASFTGNMVLPEAGDHDYAQFLGPHRSAVLPNARLARDWQTTPPRLIWRQPIGSGWGAFAVVGNYAVTQEQIGPEECVVCYRVSDGAKMWVHADPVHFDSSYGGPGPRATPTIAGGRVYTVGATGLLNCLDGGTGQRVWCVDILQDNQAENISHGVCASPLVLDDRIIVSPTGANGISLVAYGRDTGERIWQAGKHQASYGSPLLAELGGQRQILLSEAEGVTGHDAATGQVLWNFPWTNGEKVNCSQPIPNAGGAGQVFISTGYAQGCALFRVQQSADGTWSASLLWELSGRMKTKFTTPVLHQGFVYGLDDGILACVDLAKKKQVWKDGRYQHGQLLLAGELLLIQAENGEVVLVDPVPEGLRQLGRFSAIKGKTWNNPALAGRFLLVRNDQEAACYELPLEND